jgi:hypothetical protein
MRGILVLLVGWVVIVLGVLLSEGVPAILGSGALAGVLISTVCLFLLIRPR